MGPDRSPRAPWVVRVTTNLTIDVLRKREREKRRDPTQERGQVIEAGLSVVDDRLVLSEALRHLPRRQREVVVLMGICDFSQRSAAEALGLSIESVKQHSARGLAALRSAMTASGVGEGSWTTS